MNFNEYQDESRETWIFNYNNDHIRAVLGLVGECGEISEKYKKKLRGDGELNREDITKELGDVLYYLARIADYNQISLETIAIVNVAKLKDRMKRGKIKGSGDSR